MSEITYAFTEDAAEYKDVLRIAASLVRYNLRELADTKFVRIDMKNISKRKKVFWGSKNSLSIVQDYLDGLDMLTIKHKLANLLINQCAQYAPKTYVISKSNYYKARRTDFVSDFPDISPVLWFLKPSHAYIGSGHGIRISNDPYELVDSIDWDNDSKVLSLKNEHATEYVLQEQIHNPMLIEGRKSDLRMHVLIMYDKNSYRIFLHKLGYYRINAKKYDPTNPAAELQLTNISAGVATMREFNELDPIYQTVFEQLKHIVVDTIALARPHFNSHGQIGYQLLGYDFMIDMNLKAWLIEINSHPGFKGVDKFFCDDFHDIFPLMFKTLYTKKDCFDEYDLSWLNISINV